MKEVDKSWNSEKRAKTSFKGGNRLKYRESWWEWSLTNILILNQLQNSGDSTNNVKSEIWIE